MFSQSVHSEQQQKRPKVGLVLSGGGAKGFAYIGLLKVLEEVNMPVDYIGGSSMGAIIAALYSVGYSPETIEKLISEQDWDAIQETLYLMSIPGMRESIKDGLETPVEECAEELDW